MKKIIDRKVYNTETAELVGEYWNGLGSDDFRYCSEDLYKTKKGEFFLHGSEGPMSKYSDCEGGQSWGIQAIKPMSDEEAFEWLADNNEFEMIEKYFPDMLEEA